jgi:hypothetical protein
MDYILYNQKTQRLGIISIPKCSDIQNVIEKDIPSESEYIVVDNCDNINQEYFEAYELVNKEPVINIEKCKKIKLNKFRKLRIPVLEKLDIDYMKAIESNNIELQKEIANKKQQLRDVTLIQLPSAFNELKDFIPEILKEYSTPLDENGIEINQ